MKFLAADDGAFAVEYALLLALLVLACAAAIRSIGGAINAPLGRVAANIGTGRESVEASSPGGNEGPGRRSWYLRAGPTPAPRLTPVQMALTVLILRQPYITAFVMRSTAESSGRRRSP